MREIKKKQKNKKTSQERVFTKTVVTKSFFSYFRSVEGSQFFNPMDGDKEKLKVQQMVNMDFQICGAIVDEVIPYSLEYYLGI